MRLQSIQAVPLTILQCVSLRLPNFEVHQHKQLRRLPLTFCLRSCFLRHFPFSFSIGLAEPAYAQSLLPNEQTPHTTLCRLDICLPDLFIYFLLY